MSCCIALTCDFDILLHAEPSSRRRSVMRIAQLADMSLYPVTLKGLGRGQGPETWRLNPGS